MAETHWFRPSGTRRWFGVTIRCKNESLDLPRLKTSKIMTIWWFFDLFDSMQHQWNSQKCWKYNIIDPPPQNPKVMLNHPQVRETHLKDRTEGNPNVLIMFPKISDQWIPVFSINSEKFRAMFGNEILWKNIQVVIFFEKLLTRNPQIRLCCLSSLQTSYGRLWTWINASMRFWIGSRLPEHQKWVSRRTHFWRNWYFDRMNPNFMNLLESTQFGT